jgi:predicted nucleic acid-binding protein
VIRFFDTNVLVYLFDASQPQKKTRAQTLLADAVAGGGALLSTQVLQEFFVAVTRKLSKPLAHDQAELALRELASLPVVNVETATIVESISTMRRYRLSFWDSLIVRSAIKGGASVLYTEDLNDGQKIETLTVQNPFLQLTSR